MDDTDRKILRVLQEDSSLSVADIARQVNLSASPCWKRINRMQEEGIINRQVAVIDPQKVGFGITVFMSLQTDAHSSSGISDFSANVMEMPEVQECYRLAGDVDYQLKVVVENVQQFDAFYKRLVDLAPLTKVTSRFAIETIKSTTSLPI